MTDKEILEGNKLIAEFMGGEKRDNGVYETYNFPKKTKEGFMSYDVIYLEYHSSWDWLMPVYCKINKTIQLRSEVDFIFGTETSGLCLAMWNALEDENCSVEFLYVEIVRFIKWYNEFKRTAS